MPVSYAEARNMVFHKPAGPARSCFHENINSHQSVPVGLHLFSLRPEWISSFHSDASAQRSGGAVSLRGVCFAICPGSVPASADFGGGFFCQIVLAARPPESPADRLENSFFFCADE